MHLVGASIQSQLHGIHAFLGNATHDLGIMFCYLSYMNAILHTEEAQWSLLKGHESRPLTGSGYFKLAKSCIKSGALTIELSHYLTTDSTTAHGRKSILQDISIKALKTQNLLAIQIRQAQRVHTLENMHLKF